jgi:hypothetical protein
MQAARSRTELRKVLTVLDLIAIGVGATIGAGIFVTVGVVAREKVRCSARWEVAAFRPRVPPTHRARADGPRPLPLLRSQRHRLPVLRAELRGDGVDDQKRRLRLRV